MVEVQNLNKILLNKQVLIFFNPTSGNCFIKCNNRLTHSDHLKKFSTFIRAKQKRSNVMTTARIQPFCKKHNNSIGCYDVFRVGPRKLQKEI